LPLAGKPESQISTGHKKNSGKLFTADLQKTNFTCKRQTKKKLIESGLDNEGREKQSRTKSRGAGRRLQPLKVDWAAFWRGRLLETVEITTVNSEG